MDKRELAKIIGEIDKENEIFADKSSLDSLSYVPSKLIGRQKEVKNLLRYLLGYKKGHVVPLISVYGRSGSGKSTLVKYVCESLPEMHLCFVNLREAKTVFNAANLILSELGDPNLKSAQGTSMALQRIANGIESALGKKKKSLFVLALDEFDAIFGDTRGNPSDFVYKLVELQAALRKKHLMSCIVTISNNVLSDYNLDDRVRSRIGTSDVFFEPYSQDDVLQILVQRSKKAFAIKIDPAVLQYCAARSYLEHGDARRAIDLLRVAAELASSENKTVSTQHVDSASEQLQKDRVGEVLSSASYHFKLACLALAMKTFGLEQEWHTTHKLHKKYCDLVQKGTKPVSHRRFSEILRELENTGLVTSQTGSQGRKGYSSQFRLVMPPEIVGQACFPDYWKKVEEKKRARQKLEHSIRSTPKSSMFRGLDNLTKTLLEKDPFFD